MLSTWSYQVIGLVTAGICVVVASRWFMNRRAVSSRIIAEEARKAAAAFKFDEDKADSLTSFISKKYDAMLAPAEWVWGANSGRKSVMKKAKGSVLEVSAGTGRNLEYYNPESLTALTFTDKNRDMLDILKEKLNKSNLKSNIESINVHLEDVQNLSYSDNTFDTVLDTLGLCSCEFPDKALEEMLRVTKISGQVLLLQHGRSHYQWMANYQDKNVQKQFESMACVWNRDFDKLVKDAVENARGAVKLEYSKKKMFGVMCEYVITKVSDMKNMEE